METFSTPFGPFMCLKNDQNFYIHLKNNSFWEISLILKILKPYWEKARVILDIGAHIGSHSFIYSHFNRDAVIYAFEPQVEIYKVLCQNMQTRGNVMSINSSVGHTIGSANMATHTHVGENTDQRITYGDGHIMNLGGVSLGKEGERVQMITIDSLNLDGCDYMKIDVEGAESLVLQGAKNTIMKYKPIICFEYMPNFNAAEISALFSLEELPTPFDLLRTFGYSRFENVEGDNWLAFPLALTTSS